MRARVLLAAVTLAACGPTEAQVRYQQDHEHEWIAPHMLPVALQGMSDDDLRRSMGMPVEHSTTFDGTTTLTHLEFCRTFRFFRDHGEDRQYHFRDGWHPIERQALRCSRSNIVRVLMVDGRVRSAE